ncbi:hypothetical protein ACFFVB_16190 [Formosa undariae]|uniref:Uncharacterized protein n=1 Tax=Formosa undariae TaxID=1325436 RepID=A0ABV5F5F5_9FLAO
MRKILLIFIIGVLFANCANKKDEPTSETQRDLEKAQNENQIELEYIDRWNQIELAQTDDKYGEWGGDSDIILIYSDGEKVFANYSRYLGSYEPPIPPKENEKQKKWYEYKKLERNIDSIELSFDQILLIENAILELTKTKIKSETNISHSGIVNSVISKDSSLIIKDYPSNKWKSFQRLKNSIMEK